MNTHALFWGRLKALLRDGASLTILLLCIAVALLAGWYAQQKQEGLLSIAIVNEDAGILGDRVIAMLKEEQGLVFIHTDAQNARRLLIQDRVQCTALLPADFTQRLQQREFRGLVELNVSSGSAYAATVSEPLVNAVMKLWFEQQVLYNAGEFLREQGLSFSYEQELKTQMERVWHEGATVRVESIVAAETPAQMNSQPDVLLCWYAALIPFYLIISCAWMLQENYQSLLRRIRQSGCSTTRLFLTQSAAALVIATAGFILTALLGGNANILLPLLPHMLIYCLGCLGPALILCSLCRNLSALLLMAPALTLAAAVLSGLLLPLPDWAAMWVTISAILPGRNLYAALSGQANLVGALLLATAWLVTGLLSIRLTDVKEARYTKQGVDLR